MPPRTDIDALMEILSLSREQAVEALELCRWADHRQAIREHGYPRDNRVPPRMEKRLADPDYLRDMLDAVDTDQKPDAVIEAVERRLREIGGD